MELRKAKAVFGEARGNIKMILNQLKESQLNWTWMDSAHTKEPDEVAMA